MRKQNKPLFIKKGMFYLCWAMRQMNGMTKLLGTLHGPFHHQIQLQDFLSNQI
jgi:hypothetical protein